MQRSTILCLRCKLFYQSGAPHVLQDQMISDEEIDEDDVQDISSVDEQSACSIPLLANYSSKRIQITTIESVGHNSSSIG